MNSPGLVEVAVFAPLNKTFTYQWPDWLGEPLPGIRVHVPFGRGRRLGMVWRTTVSPPDASIELKAVIDRVDAAPLYDFRRMQWLERACRYYAAAPGECAETAFAWAGTEDKRRWHCIDTAALSRLDDELARAFTHRGVLSVATLRKKLPASGFYHRLRQAVEAGHLTEAIKKKGDRLLSSERSGELRPEEVPVVRSKRVSPGGKGETVPFLLPDMPAEPIPERLLPAQQQALDRIGHTSKFSSFLLFG
ncbi:MAG: hypothetical protein Q9M27_01195, partial [Mariprofundaceae bacterium]|nr:hypothetical protein [Mariprofundaceae bacterium]